MEARKVASWIKRTAIGGGRLIVEHLKDRIFISDMMAIVVIADRDVSEIVMRQIVNAEMRVEPGASCRRDTEGGVKFSWDLKLPEVFDKDRRRPLIHTGLESNGAAIFSFGPGEYLYINKKYLELVSCPHAMQYYGTLPTEPMRINYEYLIMPTLAHNNKFLK